MTLVNAPDDGRSELCILGALSMSDEVVAQSCAAAADALWVFLGAGFSGKSSRIKCPVATFREAKT